MRTPIMMSAGAFEMAPLSDFIVTETRPRPKVLPKMAWDEWHRRPGIHMLETDFNYGGYTANGRQKLVMRANRPTDVEVELSTTDALYYVIVWADDPEPT